MCSSNQVTRLLKVISDLKQQGLGIPLVEQHVHQSLQIADCVAVLELGRLVVNKPTSEVQGVDEIQVVYFGPANRTP